MKIEVSFTSGMKNADLIRGFRIIKDATGRNYKVLKADQLEEAYSILIDLFEIIEPERNRRLIAAAAKAEAEQRAKAAARNRKGTAAQ